MSIRALETLDKFTLFYTYSTSSPYIAQILNKFTLKHTYSIPHTFDQFDSPSYTLEKKPFFILLFSSEDVD